jgi:hypothetical protein
MAQRSEHDDKVPVSSFSLREWLAASVALAIGGGIALFLLYLSFWTLGLPGPLLWMGSGNVLADIVTVSLAIVPMVLFANFLGSFVVATFFELWRRYRS